MSIDPVEDPLEVRVRCGLPLKKQSVLPARMVVRRPNVAWVEGVTLLPPMRFQLLVLLLKQEGSKRPILRLP